MKEVVLLGFKERARGLNRKYIVAACVAAAVAAVLALYAAKPGPGQTERDIFAMGTLVHISVSGGRQSELNAAVSEAAAEITRLEKLFSSRLSDSEISKINANPALAGGHTISAETYELLSLALRVAEETNGAFDPTVGAAVALWGIGTESARIPADAEIEKVLQTIDWRKVRLWREEASDEQSTGVYKASAGEGQMLDLGGIAKGFAADRAVDILRSRGVKSALLDLGGDLTVAGESPKGRPWRLGLQHPDEARGNYFAVVTAADAALVTSGTYERFFEQDGVRYHHILDPVCGYPSRSDLKSVSVIMKNGGGEENSARSDALSTALFVMGMEKARAFLERHGEVQAVLVTERDGETIIYVTEGLRDAISLKLEAFPSGNGDSAAGGRR